MALEGSGPNRKAPMAAHDSASYSEPSSPGPCDGATFQIKDHVMLCIDPAHIRSDHARADQSTDLRGTVTSGT